MKISLPGTVLPFSIVCMQFFFKRKKCGIAQLGPFSIFTAKKYILTQKELDYMWPLISGLGWFNVQNLMKAYGLTWGQCSEIMKIQSQVHQDYNKVDDDWDGVGLLLIIKGISLNFNSHKYPAHGLREALRKFYIYMQVNMVSLQD